MIDLTADSDRDETQPWSVVCRQLMQANEDARRDLKRARRDIKL